MKKNNKKTVKNDRRISDIVTIVLFLGFIFGFAIAFVLMPDVSSNEYENTLQRLPYSEEDGVKAEDRAEVLTEGTLHGELATKMDEYFCDQFPFRKQFVTIKAMAEKLSLRGANNGVSSLGDYLITTRFNSAGFDTLTEFYSEEHVQTTLESLKAAIDTASVPVDVLLPPRAIDVMAPLLDYPTYVSDKLNGQAAEILGDNYVDVMEYLRTLTFEIPSVTQDIGVQPYFMTDHHWTPVGAFYAMEKWMSEWNDLQPQFESFDYEYVRGGFLGTSGRNGNYYNHKGEAMDISRFTGEQNIRVKVGQSLSALMEDNEKAFEEYVGMYDMEALNSPDPYNVYLYGKSKYVHLQHKTEDRETILLLKDSFAHVFAPQLARYYDVVMVDMDLVNNISLSNLIEKTGADRVLIMYNLQNVIENDRLATIKP